jgi:hypothetical protein
MQGLHSTTPNPASVPQRVTPVEPAKRLPSAATEAAREELSYLLDPEARFGLLSQARQMLEANYGEEVIRLLRDVERPFFRQIGRQYRHQLRELSNFSEYVEFLNRILKQAENRYRRDRLVREVALMDSSRFELIVTMMRIQLSAYLETIL